MFALNAEYLFVKRTVDDIHISNTNARFLLCITVVKEPAAVVI